MPSGSFYKYYSRIRELYDSTIPRFYGLLALIEPTDRPTGRWMDGWGIFRLSAPATIGTGIGSAGTGTTTLSFSLHCLPLSLALSLFLVLASHPALISARHVFIYFGLHKKAQHRAVPLLKFVKKNTRCRQYMAHQSGRSKRLLEWKSGERKTRQSTEVRYQDKRTTEELSTISPKNSLTSSTPPLPPLVCHPQQPSRTPALTEVSDLLPSSSRPKTRTKTNQGQPTETAIAS